MIGNGDLGIGGFDREIAAKYKLPVVALLWSNTSWGLGFEQHPVLKDRTAPFAKLPSIRYDRSFAEMGCQGALVERPEEIVPALARALTSGKPAVINVLGANRIGHPPVGGNLLGSAQR